MVSPIHPRTKGTKNMNRATIDIISAAESIATSAAKRGIQSELETVQSRVAIEALLGVAVAPADQWTDRELIEIRTRWPALASLGYIDASVPMRLKVVG